MWSKIISFLIGVLVGIGILYGYQNFFLKDSKETLEKPAKIETASGTVLQID